MSLGGLVNIIINNIIHPEENNDGCKAPSKGCIYPYIRTSEEFNVPGFCSYDPADPCRPYSYCKEENHIPCFQTLEELQACNAKCGAACSALCYDCGEDGIIGTTYAPTSEEPIWTSSTTDPPMTMTTEGITSEEPIWTTNHGPFKLHIKS
jgi:hypothetical protein